MSSRSAQRAYDAHIFILGANKKSLKEVFRRIAVVQLVESRDWYDLAELCDDRAGLKLNPARSVRIKKGASIYAMQPEMLIGLLIVDSVYLRVAGHDATLTSGTDFPEVHGRNSLHKKGFAADLRTSDVPKSLLPTLFKEVAAALGSDFDAVLETDHLHVEFDPV